MNRLWIINLALFFILFFVSNIIHNRLSFCPKIILRVTKIKVGALFAEAYGISVFHFVWVNFHILVSKCFNGIFFNLFVLGSLSEVWWRDILCKTHTISSFPNLSLSRLKLSSFLKFLYEVNLIVQNLLSLIWTEVWHLWWSSQIERPSLIPSISHNLFWILINFWHAI